MNACEECGASEHYPTRGTTIVKTKMGRKRAEGRAVLACMGYVGKSRAWRLRDRHAARQTMGTFAAVLDGLMEEYEDAVIAQLNSSLWSSRL
jgi:hypothetical protein